MSCTQTSPAALLVVEATYDRATGRNAAAVGNLAAALRMAKNAHASWESEHGSDTHWSTWYAKYLLGLDVTPAGLVPEQVAGYGVAL